MDPAPEISGGQVDSVKGGFAVTLNRTNVMILGMTVHSREQGTAARICVDSGKTNRDSFVFTLCFVFVYVSFE